MTRYLTCTETAKLVRAALKTAFPGTKFSVRADTYSLGASIRVTWVDGQIEAQVREVTDRFVGKDHDALTDATTRRDPIEADGGLVQSGADHVFVTRRLSAEFRATLEAKAAEILGEPVNESRWYSGSYPTEFGEWKAATGYNLILWLGDRMSAETSNA